MQTALSVSRPARDGAHGIDELVVFGRGIVDAAALCEFDAPCVAVDEDGGDLTVDEKAADKDAEHAAAHDGDVLAAVDAEFFDGGVRKGDVLDEERLFIAHRFGEQAELVFRHIDEVAQEAVGGEPAQKDVVFGEVALFHAVAGGGEGGVQENARPFGEVRAAFIGDEPHGEPPGDAGIAHLFRAAEEEGVAAVDKDFGDADLAFALFGHGLRLLLADGIRSSQSPNIHDGLLNNNFCRILSRYTAIIPQANIICNCFARKRGKMKIARTGQPNLRLPDKNS